MEPASLRERKKQRTKQALQAAALRLIEERGYDAATVEDIAAAAEVSPRTFFRYFASKEDVIVDGEEDYRILARLASQSATGFPIDLARDAIRAEGATIEEEEMEMLRARSRLVFATPALLARALDGMQQLEDEMAAILAGRFGRRPDDLAIQVSAAAMMAALRVAVMRWAQEDNRAGLFDLVDDALDVLAGGLRLQPEQPSKESHGSSAADL